jgi:hypothetical protein
MSAELMLRYADEATDPVGDLDVRFENTTNTPIVSIAWRGNGQAVAGTYLLEFTKSGGVTVDVTGEGTGATSRNPWGDRTGLGVTADDSTENFDIIPGLGIVVDSSVDTGWTARVTIGNYLDDGTKLPTEILEFEVIQAGLTSSERRVACRNVGSETAEAVTIYSLPGWWFDGTGAEEFIEAILPHSDPTKHKLAAKGSVVITFADFKLDGATGKYTCDVLVDAVKCVEDAQMDGETVYEDGVTEYISDELPGMGIILPNTTSDPTSSSITLEVRDSYTWTELAPDVTGSPGTYSTDDLVLGDIDAADHEFFWIRIPVPSAAQPEDPCRMGNLRARGLSI